MIRLILIYLFFVLCCLENIFLKDTFFKIISYVFMILFGFLVIFQSIKILKSNYRTYHYVLHRKIENIINIIMLGFILFVVFCFFFTSDRNIKTAGFLLIVSIVGFIGELELCLKFKEGLGLSYSRRGCNLALIVFLFIPVAIITASFVEKYVVLPSQMYHASQTAAKANEYIKKIFPEDRKFIKDASNLLQKKVSELKGDVLILKNNSNSCKKLEKELKAYGWVNNNDMIQSIKNPYYLTILTMFNCYDLYEVYDEDCVCLQNFYCVCLQNFDNDHVCLQKNKKQKEEIVKFIRNALFCGFDSDKNKEKSESNPEKTLAMVANDISVVEMFYETLSQYNESIRWRLFTENIRLFLKVLSNIQKKFKERIKDEKSSWKLPIYFGNFCDEDVYKITFDMINTDERNKVENLYKKAYRKCSCNDINIECYAEITDQNINEEIKKLGRWITCWTIEYTYYITNNTLQKEEATE